ncbi:hypothetical protein BB559_002218 [Furculomyces boomerangus]|uniref:Inorganic pyrophosphatase n=2 Tax=Harpellales TaxID=61421 RepID=A0A2T9YX46_9FUNG|nr:hypothetical protein BB559_002218 [Furculomyces boomerangus]PWA02359.1 hypothetical protein BB558_001499 [Smittium angustum]
MPFSTRTVGKPDTLEYKVYLEKDGKIVSFFHDIPLFADVEKKVYNMVVEVPRWTNAKMEIKTGDKFNPIVQDIKKGALRYVCNTFPHHGYIWNYGALPQTWEDPEVTSPDTGCVGDKDPIDVCEIGEKIGYTGQIKQVKVLGIVAMVDEGETDWKVIAIDVTDPMAEHVNDIDDVQQHFPGLLKATVEWLRLYKVPDGKGENQFAFNSESKGRSFAEEIIAETHESWRTLVNSASNSYGMSVTNSTVEGTPGFSTQPATDIMENSTPAEIPTIHQSVHKWYFVKGSRY